MPVSARFHCLRDQVLAGVDQVFAEPIRLSFMKNGAADPDRQQIVIEAILRTEPSKSGNVGTGSGGHWQMQITAGITRLYIDRASYTGPQPRQGDKVRALARAGEPVFEVVDVNDRGHTRLVLDLNEA